jgi:MYXO-CTERM domain-containing protein
MRLIAGLASVCLGLLAALTSSLASASATVSASTVFASTVFASTVFASTGPRPDIPAASAYLAAPRNLIAGHYYQAVPGAADFGLTIDGALALAATGDQDRALRAIVAFLDSGGKDPSGKTINYWTGIGTRYASGGDIGKEALLAEVVGDNPRRFGGRDLIAALDATICTSASPGAGGRCAGPGGYAYATSVFDQALGVIAQLRAGQSKLATVPVSYLESLRRTDGSFPSLIPAGGQGGDVDSTAVAVMALALVPGAKAAADVRSGLAWIASRQEPGGGFPGAGGDSVNSAALAVQALGLDPARYGRQIDAARAFLAAEQNTDGGFRADASGQRASDLRASAQATSGSVGVSYGRLHRDLAAKPGPGPASSGPTVLIVVLAALALAAAAALAALRLRRRRRTTPPAAGNPVEPAGRITP